MSLHKERIGESVKQGLREVTGFHDARIIGFEVIDDNCELVPCKSADDRIFGSAARKRSATVSSVVSPARCPKVSLISLK